MAAELEELAARLRSVEDELAIRRVILLYGPAVDSGEGTRAGALWADDGEYDYDLDRPTLVGPGDVERMLEDDVHQALIADGAAHFAGPPLIELDGDRATALSYSFLFRRDPETRRMYVGRLGAAQWEFARVDGAWRIQRRTHRQLDTTGGGRELFGDALRSGFGTSFDSETGFEKEGR